MGVGMCGSRWGGGGVENGGGWYLGRRHAAECPEEADEEGGLCKEGQHALEGVAVVLLPDLAKPGCVLHLVLLSQAQLHARNLCMLKHR